MGTTEEKEHEGRVHWRKSASLKGVRRNGGDESCFAKCCAADRLLGGSVLRFSFYLLIFCAWKSLTRRPLVTDGLATLLLVVPFPAGLLISLCVKVCFLHCNLCECLSDGRPF